MVLPPVTVAVSAPASSSTGQPGDAAASSSGGTIKLLSAPPTLKEAGTKPARPSHETDQLVLYWPDAATAQRELGRIQREFGLTPSDKANLNGLGGTMVQFRNISRKDLAAIQSKMRESAPTASVNLNAIYYPQSGPRQYFGEQIGTVAPDGPAVPVGIVDGEVSSIPALSKAKIVRRSFLTGGDRPSPTTHATAIASLIVGRESESGFSGIAPAAKLHVASVMRNDGTHDSTTTYMLAKALDWLVEQRVRVINLSLGGPGDPLMEQMIAKLLQNPVVVIAAAGNSGPEAPPSYPAAYPGVIAVTATNAANTVYQRANRGDYIAVAAPGEDLWVPTASGGQYVSGTSFAAALASGTASRVLALKQEWDARALREHFCRHAREMGASRTSPVYGCGLLQLRTSLEAISPGALSASR